MTETTLCYIEKDNQYLMLLRNKKAVDLNEGKWIGVGGKLEAGETPEQCALREIREETGLTALRLIARGVITFRSDVWGEERMYLYTVPEFEGELTACDEGELHWVDKDDVFDLRLWDGDRIFLHYLLTDTWFFEMTLDYRGDRLDRCVVDGREVELFDVYNADGSPAGYVADRGFVHWKGLWHVTAHIWVVNRDEAGQPMLLLQLRSTQKRLYPGCWDISSAGHIAAGEDVAVGAVRELEEELGIRTTVDALEYLDTLDMFYDDDEGEGYHDKEHCSVFVYRGEVHDSDLILQAAEVDEVKWISYGELLEAVRGDRMKHCLELSELELLASVL